MYLPPIIVLARLAFQWPVLNRPGPPKNLRKHSFDLFFEHHNFQGPFALGGFFGGFSDVVLMHFLVSCLDIEVLIGPYSNLL